MSINKKEDISYLVGILLIISDVSSSYKTGTVRCDKLMINQIIRGYIVNGRGNFETLEKNYDDLLNRVNTYIDTELSETDALQRKTVSIPYISGNMKSFRDIYNYLIKNFLDIINSAKWNEMVAARANIAGISRQPRLLQGGKKSKKQPKKKIFV